MWFLGVAFLVRTWALSSSFQRYIVRMVCSDRPLDASACAVWKSILGVNLEFRKYLGVRTRLAALPRGNVLREI